MADAMPGLYMASTPLIALSCAAAALDARAAAVLVLIEDFDLAPRLQALLESWRDNPFDRIIRIPGRYHGPGRAVQGKRRWHAPLRRAGEQRASRKQTLAMLRALDAELRPGRVWLGNDRRVETQLPLELASRRMGGPVGQYLDDGLYSYLGDVRQGRDRWRLDDEFKRLAYGRWWTRVGHVGTSPWIATAWLAFPQLAPAAYAGRQVSQLPKDWYAGRAFGRLCVDAAHAFMLDRATLRACDAVVVMPHSGQLSAHPDFAASLRGLLARMAAGGRRVALKYHPRETTADPCGLMQAGASMLLPPLLPMELMLPLLSRGALLMGEITTALLAAHWLRPDLEVRCMGLARGGYAERARALFQCVGIADDQDEDEGEGEGEDALPGIRAQRTNTRA